ncbi:hypothetical protein PoB_003380200 [Plakobranchus ocellatus]|uniref:Uncharacterized protein n=1 Tax=Plakobranchus ocellatus TaxID=259542 RepID=A0AAV4AJ65_9GAST|nr:hypothetical protein PoB_003380200 [Plakobranchus ocellatus]
MCLSFSACVLESVCLWFSVCVLESVCLCWLKTNCPVYFASVRDTVGPLLIVVWTSLKDFVMASEQVTRPHRAWMVEKALGCYHWLYELSPETWAWCHDTTLLAWEATLHYSLVLWKHCVQLAADGQLWLTDHVFTEAMSTDSLKATAQWTVNQLKNYTTLAWSSILTMVK